jgi:hypothetical protein
MPNNAVRLTSAAATAVLIACSSAPPAAQSPSPGQPVAGSARTLPPAGYGTLRQDDFSVALQSGAVQLKLTPLDEAVIRLAAPDTYQRLHRLVETRGDQIREKSQLAGLQTDPAVFLVSFFTRDVQAAFQPTEVQLLSRGILYRPLAILPLTPDWGRQQLRQEQSESALYLFEPAIDLNVVFNLQYGSAVTAGWAAIIGVLEAERGRVMSRARG